VGKLERQGGTLPALVALAVLVAALVALIVQAEMSDAPVVSQAKTALWWLAAALLGGLIALAAWLLERRRTAPLRSELAQAKDRAARWHRSDDRERKANRELRDKVAELQKRQGTFGDWGDIKQLVLHMSMTLTEARRGLLLLRADDDGDGVTDRLVPSANEGIDETDPVAKRFAEEVIERDTIVREDTVIAIPVYVADQFSGVVVCADRKGGFDDIEDDVLLALGDHAGAVLHNGRLHDELRVSYISTIRMLAEAIQAKDPFLRGHSEEVHDYVAAVAERLGLDAALREQLAVGSLLHDVGKIGISERILHKPAKLTQEEFAIIQLHPRIGYRLIEQVPALRHIAPAVLHHHERYDGGGYPSGLVGEQIPLEARIVCVADAFSAMTADRPYRSRMPLEAACEELEANAGTQFDPQIVSVFVDEVRKKPPAVDDSLADALADAELQLHRESSEPVLGAGAVALSCPVTLLYSHRYLHEAAAAEAERSRIQEKPFTVVLAHMDEVEHVNEVDGYAAGDSHLRSCARSLSKLAVQLGATACREGGLTLALLVPASREVEPDVVATQTREALRECGGVRVAVEQWRPGDSGDAVIARARASLAGAASPS
jgi:diguanylate cyclase (GGDEF)-like protein